MRVEHKHISEKILLINIGVCSTLNLFDNIPNVYSINRRALVNLQLKKRWLMLRFLCGYGRNKFSSNPKLRLQQIQIVKLYCQYLEEIQVAIGSVYFREFINSSIPKNVTVEVFKRSPPL